jgi:meiotically up-regulated gene 157 (Mug157) protein
VFVATVKIVYVCIMYLSSCNKVSLQGIGTVTHELKAHHFLSFLVCTRSSYAWSNVLFSNAFLDLSDSDIAFFNLI